MDDSDRANAAGPDATAPANARERILEAAYDLFSRHGVRAVGIDAIIERSGVARMTLYRQFGSKEDLVVEFLKRREKRWTRDWLIASVEQRASEPRARLLAIFDVFDEWFRQPDFEGCAFVTILVETADPDPDASQTEIYRECARHLANIRSFIERLATEAGIPDAAAFGRKWQILMKGSIISATEGDLDAARRAKEIAALVVSEALPVSR
ncbi:MAG: TetR/AcrR family transcriptional regulator [Bryobacteraceae bacterium]